MNLRKLFVPFLALVPIMGCGGESDGEPEFKMSLIECEAISRHPPNKFRLMFHEGTRDREFYTLDYELTNKNLIKKLDGPGWSGEITINRRNGQFKMWYTIPESSVQFDRKGQCKIGGDNSTGWRYLNG